MKAILVVDVEEHGDYYVDLYRKDADDSFEGRYYLKPMPERKPLMVVDWIEHRDNKGKIIENYMVRSEFNEGWNACIDAIVGETE